MLKSTAEINLIRNPANIKENTDFLITAIACEELARYYRYWVKKSQYIDLIRPGWKPHITVSKINPVEKLELIAHYDKKQIEFSYEPIVRFSGDVGTNIADDKYRKYWFIDVYSDDIQTLRSILGLPDYTKFHITIGLLSC